MKEYQSLITLVEKIGYHKANVEYNRFIDLYKQKHFDELEGQTNMTQWYERREKVFERYSRIIR